MQNLAKITWAFRVLTFKPQKSFIFSSTQSCHYQVSGLNAVNCLVYAVKVNFYGNYCHLRHHHDYQSANLSHPHHRSVDFPLFIIAFSVIGSLSISVPLFTSLFWVPLGLGRWNSPMNSVMNCCSACCYWFMKSLSPYSGTTISLCSNGFWSTIVSIAVSCGRFFTRSSTLSLQTLSLPSWTQYCHPTQIGSRGYFMNS